MKLKNIKKSDVFWRKLPKNRKKTKIAVLALFCIFMKKKFIFLEKKIKMI